MADPTPSPTDVADLRARVGKALAEFQAGQAELLDGVSPELGPLQDCLAEMLTGGKRLRPAFAYWGYRGAGGEDSDALVRAAASLELFQACALVHDDLMDGSDTRRGLPAAHRRFASLHRTESWRGDPEAFGAGAAILLGDLCLSWADEMLGRCGLPEPGLAAGRRVFDTMRTELMGGQYLDLLEQAMGGASVARAMRVIRFKSAKYTIERPLHLGAALAGAPPALSEAYTAYGLPLGEAFQLRDDVLGVFGDPAVTGKPAGDDLREGKRTVLVALALAEATAAQAASVRRHLGDPHLTLDGVDELRTVLTETGALAAVEAMVDERCSAAFAALDSPAIDADARVVLTDLAVAATARSV